MVAVETIGEVNRGRFFYFRPLHQLNSSLAPKGACSYYLKSGGLALTPLWSRQPKQVYGQAPFGVLGGMMAEWFKFPTQLVDSRPIRYIAFETRQPKAVVVGVWTMILSYADESKEPGKLKIGNLSLGPIIAQETGLDSDIISQLIKSFIEFEMLDCVDGFLTVVSWNELHEAPADWNLSKFREPIFHRDSICVYCGYSPECLDHIIPRSRGGQNWFNNLVACCNRCNRSKYDSDMEEWYRSQPFFKPPRLEYIKHVMRQSCN